MRIFITSILLLGVVSAYSITREEVIEYIDLYKFIAVEEMQKYGIPASIKMAQAILESNAGLSDLATEANNHFGIKCGGVWTGPTYYKKDDDRDKKGRLIKSCFRVFKDAEDSFRAHSQFLLDPQKTYRYGPLFEIERTDYKSWAWGLSKAGYATNPAYANLLIHLIEKYALYTFDYYENSNVKFVNPADVVVEAREINQMEKLEKKSDNALVSQQESQMRPNREQQVVINDRTAVKVLEGQTMEQLARKYDLPPQKILQYNDNDLGLDDYLNQGMYVFLEKKRIWYRGEQKYHIVKEGEDLRRISQLYGIRLSTLERKNKIDADMIPLPGQKIVLRGRSARGDKIPLTYDDVEIVETNQVTKPTLADELDANILPTGGTPDVAPDEKTTRPDENLNHSGENTQANLDIDTKNSPNASVSMARKQTQTVDFDKKDILFLNESPVPDVNIEPEEKSVTVKQSVQTYRVVKGDTLYSISRKFGVSVDSLRHHNQLLSDQISIDQELKIVR